MTEFLSKENILSVQDMGGESVYVPEWSGNVFVAVLTAAERDQFETEIDRLSEAKQGMIGYRARFVAACLRNPETHERLFSPTEAMELQKKNGAVLHRLFLVGNRINKMRKIDYIEEQKNSSSVQADSSSSG